MFWRKKRPVNHVGDLVLPSPDDSRWEPGVYDNELFKIGALMVQPRTVTVDGKSIHGDFYKMVNAVRVAIRERRQNEAMARINKELDRLNE